MPQSGSAGSLTERSVRPRVVIVGAGFGGLQAAKRLADVDVEVIIIDRRNHHLFQPLLYQVASAGLNPSDIAQPIRQILRDQANCTVMLGEVTGVDLPGRTVTADGRTVNFDYLVLATGATHAYFGNDEWERHAPGLKSIEDALDIRARILKAFERAELAEGAEQRELHMTFAIVGAGPTGVELAGAVKEIAMRTLRDDFRNIDTGSASVILVEAGPAVLPTFSPKLSKSAERQLKKLGVEVRTNTRVTNIDRDGVDTDQGRIPTRTVLWAAGVAASPIGSLVSSETDRSGRVPVTEHLHIQGHDRVFVIGDLAAVVDEAGANVPGVAPAAEQAGEHVAQSITADLAGRPRLPFRYVDKGSMATIGRSKAVVQVGDRVQFGGYVAWVIWWLVHIWSLVGFRNRLRTMAGWGWQYWTGHRQARLITNDLEN